MTAMRLKRYPSPSGGIALGKMGVGATLLKQGKTARDYVQDGLIAMWDGIENAGWGQHDPNATVWNNLTGNGNDLTLTEYGSWGNKYLLNAIGGEGASCNDSISGYGTMEVVLSSTGWNKYGTGYFVCAGPGYFFGQRNAISNGNRIADSANYGILSDINIGINGIHSWSLYHAKNTNGTIYKDGVAQRVNLSSSNGASATPISVYAKGYPNSFYCIRIYDRALTAAEIAANYAIDKERFNLP